MRKKCKRKVWNLINRITHAMEGAAVSSRDLLDQLELLRTGQQDRHRVGALREVARDGREALRQPELGCAVRRPGGDQHDPPTVVAAGFGEPAKSDQAILRRQPKTN